MRPFRDLGVELGIELKYTLKIYSVEIVGWVHLAEVSD
jgi:hypothetical protein